MDAPRFNLGAHGCLLDTMSGAKSEIRSLATVNAGVESESLQEVRVPGMVSNPPLTRERQIEDTSTPANLVSSSFKIAALMQGLSTPCLIISQTSFSSKSR